MNMPSSHTVPRASSLALCMVLLLGAAPVAAQLTPGHLLINDQQFGFGPDPDTGQDVTWGGILLADPDVDTAGEDCADPTDTSCQLLYEDVERLRRPWALHPYNLDEVLIVDSYADPAGLGPDANPENSDGNPDNDTGGPGAIWRVDVTTGTIAVVSDGTEVATGLPAGVTSAFVSPRDFMVLGDGDLLVIDPDSDVAGFGMDPGRPDASLAPHAGYGALLRVDPTTGVVSVVSDGSQYNGQLPDIDGDTSPEPSVFLDPWSLAPDPNDPNGVFVLDTLADPGEDGHFGAVFHVDLTTGEVSLRASVFAFEFLNGMTFKDSAGTNGNPLVADVSLNDMPFIHEVGALGAVTDYGAPPSLAFPWEIFTDESDQLFLVDSDADPLSLSVIGSAVFHIPDSNTDLAEVVHTSAEAFFFVAADRVPTSGAPDADPQSFGVVCPGSSISLQITGSGFDSDAVILVSGQGSGVSVQNLSVVSSSIIEADLVIDDTADSDDYPIRVFDPSSRLASDVGVLTVDANLTDTGPPADPRGDINGDDFIDGLDLSPIGLAFGTVQCQDPEFDNDADLNDDGRVDGDDLSLFAPNFGLRLKP